MMNNITDVFKVFQRSLGLCVYFLILPVFVVVCLTFGMFQYWACGLSKEHHPFVQIANMWRGMGDLFSGRNHFLRL